MIMRLSKRTMVLAWRALENADGDIVNAPM